MLVEEWPVRRETLFSTNTATSLHPPRWSYEFRLTLTIESIHWLFHFIDDLSLTVAKKYIIAFLLSFEYIYNIYYTRLRVFPTFNWHILIMVRNQQCSSVNSYKDAYSIHLYSKEINVKIKLWSIVRIMTLNSFTLQYDGHIYIKC